MLYIMTVSKSLGLDSNFSIDGQMNKGSICAGLLALLGAVFVIGSIVLAAAVIPAIENKIEDAGKICGKGSDNYESWSSKTLDESNAP